MGTQFSWKKYMWKINVRLKNEFSCSSYIKDVVTKDNLAKRWWNGFTKCVFCGVQEKIDHLSISCPFSRLVWRVVHFTYNTPLPTNITNPFCNWLIGMDNRIKARIHVGACPLVWKIWNCCNKVMFNNVSSSIFGGYPQAASSVHMWSYLIPAEDEGAAFRSCPKPYTYGY
jgi:hypothetical protein